MLKTLVVNATGVPLTEPLLSRGFQSLCRPLSNRFDPQSDNREPVQQIKL